MHGKMQERTLLGGLRGQAVSAWWLGTAAQAEGRPVLQLALAWGDQLLEAGPVESGTVTLGDAPGCTVAAPVEGRHVVARPVDGGVELVAPPGGRLERWSDGAGQVCEGPIVLGADQKAVLRVGALELAFRFGRPAERLAGGAAGPDLGFARAVSFSVMGAAFLLGVIGVTPRGGPALGDRLVARPASPRSVVLVPPKPPEAGDPAPKPAGLEGVFGRQDRPQRDTAPSKKRRGGRDQVLDSGLLAGLREMRGVAGDVFSGGGLGTGINEALGGLKGNGIGDAGGLGALGSRGVGPGGGGTGLSLGTLGTGGSGRGGLGGGIDLGAGGKKRATRIVPGTTRVIGGLSKEVIGQTIARYAAQIRACYERELQRDPGLQGKVAVLFTIDGSGHVSMAETSEDTVGDGAVARCMLGRIRGWRFPEPKGGGEVIVTYPWIFRAAGG